MKVMRVVLFEGDDETMEKQLKNSLKPGFHDLATKITIVEIRNEDTIREIASVAFLRKDEEKINEGSK